MIAPPSDIRSAIRAYYTGSGAPAHGDSDAPDEVSITTEPPPARAPEPVLDTPASPAVAGAPKIAKPALVAQPTPAPFEAVVVPKPARPPPKPDESAPPSDSPTIEAREISMPAPPRKRARRMVTLTLLDGTRVNLPARSAPPAPGAPEEMDPPLTARDMVAALRAVAHGADASEILGDKARWEPLFAALLELLLKKHLIADWEFVEEFKKI
jgi:hypothetical protein